MALHDFLPDEKLREVRNLHDFAGMLVFDKWVCNTNGRQTVFFEEAPRTGESTPGAAAAGVTQGEVARGTLAREEAAHGETGRGRAYKRGRMDQGLCCNAGEWNFPDA